MSAETAELDADQRAYLVLEAVRWPSGKPAACPHCKQPCRFYFLKSQGGAGIRHTRTGAGTVRRIWKCGACRRQFSVLTGTVLQGTRISLSLWVQLIVQLCESPSALTNGQLAADLDLSRQAVWGMTKRLQQASPTDGPLGELLAAAAQKHGTPTPFVLRMPEPSDG